MRNLAEKQNGSITLLETEGEGSVFELSFPATS
ncbi:UNVERIFIED_CONTAM: signal transduction histidine kinase [Paenibacillus sp. PvR008]